MKTLICILIFSAFIRAENPIVDNYAGLGEARDREQRNFSRELVEKARREGGTVKIVTWVYKGFQQYYAMRRIDSIPGCTVWQVPNPPMGYHTYPRREQIIAYPKP